MLAVRRLRRTEAPVVELSVLAVPSFAITTVGAGLAYRAIVSATPFLLPLLFQLGFGLSAAASGLRVLVYFLGNLAMKTITTPLLRRFGFRAILVWNGLLGAAAIAASGLLAPETAPWVLVAVLLAAGAIRSMELTALSSLAFADVDPRDRSSASTLSSVSGQASMSRGVAIAALLLEASRLAHGRGALGRADLAFAFVGLGGAAAFASLRFLRLPVGAGDDVSGRTRAMAPSSGRSGTVEPAE